MGEAEEKAAAEAAAAEAAKAKAEEGAAAEAKANAEAEAAAAAKAKAEEDNPDLAQANKDNADLVREVMVKKQKVKDAEEATAKAKKEAADAKALLKTFEGIDPKEVKVLLQERANREKTALEKAGDWEKLKTNMAEEHVAEVATLKSESETALAELKAKLDARDLQLNELTIGREFGDSEFVVDSLTLTPAKARIIYGDNFELKDGKVVGFDKPSADETRSPLVDSSGVGLPFNEAIKRIVEADPDRDRLIRAKIKPGSKSGTDEGKPGEKVGHGRDRIAKGLADLNRKSAA